MSEAVAIALPQPRSYARSATAALKGIGYFMYGDEERTRRSLFFAYACIAFYVLAGLNAQLFTAHCGG